MAADTSWIVAGAPVLVYTPRYHADTAGSFPLRTTIKRVAVKSFTVDDPAEPRFDLATQEYRVLGAWGIGRCAGGSSGWTATRPAKS